MNPVAYIKAHSIELQCQNTGVEPRLQALPLKAILFDIYGTLMISASGDIGIASKLSKSDAFEQAVSEIYGADCAADQQLLLDLIAADHQRLRAQGHPFPEVDIREIWQQAARQLELDDGIDQASAAAVVYECATNPVWPMPGMQACLHYIQQTGIQTGIISNAQFYTPLLFPALSGQSLSEWGFNQALCWFSYESRRAKPDTWMYQQAADRLQADYGIAADEVLYVGNDMLNDMLPAQQVGFRTALFAGDQRSLRLREDHAEAAQVTVDCILTELQQLQQILQLS